MSKPFSDPLLFRFLKPLLPDSKTDSKNRSSRFQNRFSKPFSRFQNPYSFWALALCGKRAEAGGRGRQCWKRGCDAAAGVWEGMKLHITLPSLLYGPLLMFLFSPPVWDENDRYSKLVSNYSPFYGTGRAEWRGLSQKAKNRMSHHSNAIEDSLRTGCCI